MSSVAPKGFTITCPYLFQSLSPVITQFPPKELKNCIDACALDIHLFKNVFKYNVYEKKANECKVYSSR